ncbi:MAG: DUF2088 domain-containing protein [Anaerolineales bacterium]|nr:DUF2088 domain-containing protein [Anaerolineales bacterium]
MTMPELIPVQWKLPQGTAVNPITALEAEWTRLELAAQVASKQIAIGIGSRGVAEIDTIARTLVRLVAESGGTPFIVPAMGSHGGATASGQIEVLDSLGVSEATMGCPIRATMETVVLGETARGIPVHFDKFAAEADGLIVANRVKIHTDFHGLHESGVVKMLGIGLGKERGATLLHNFGVVGLRDYMPEVTAVILQKINLIAGIATVEDGTHRPVHLQAMPASELLAEEQKLLDLARSYAPRLPVADLDLLIVEEMGKEISGTGMDTNVIGRWRIAGEPEPESPRIRAIVVLNLTEASHGNSVGIGLADFTTRRLLDKINFDHFTTNTFTSGFLERGRLPLVFPSDEAAINAALTHLFRPNPQDRPHARIMRIRNTLDLGTVWVSPNLVDEIGD